MSDKKIYVCLKDSDYAPKGALAHNDEVFAPIHGHKHWIHLNELMKYGGWRATTELETAAYKVGHRNMYKALRYGLNAIYPDAYSIHMKNTQSIKLIKL